MSREQEWLKKINSDVFGDKMDAMKLVTPRLAEKYKDEISKMLKEDTDLFPYLSTKIKKTLPDVCVNVVEMDPQKICYIPEEIVKQNPEMLGKVTDVDWINLVKSGRYTNMPPEVVGKYFKQIGMYFKLREDGTSRFSKEVCDLYPDIVKEAIQKTIGRDRNVAALKASFPREVLKPYAEKIEELEKQMGANKILSKQKAAAEQLACDVKKAVEIAKNKEKQKVDKKRGDLDDGAR